MDCNASQVKKSRLTLEARHSRAIEASNKIRSNLTPRLFIPRAPLKKEIFRKHITKETISKAIFTKYQKSINSKNNTHFSDNHNRIKKDQNKTPPKIKIRLLQGRPKWRIMENNVTNKKTTKTNRVKKETTNEIPKNKRTRRKGLKENFKNLVRLKEAYTSQENSTTSFSYSSSLENSPHKILKPNRAKALYTRNSNIQLEIPDKTNKEPQEHYLYSKEKRNSNVTKKILNNIDCINLINEPDAPNSPHQVELDVKNKQSVENYNTPENFDAHWQDYCREALKTTTYLPTKNHSTDNGTVSQGLVLDMSGIQANHTYDDSFKNVFKNSTKIPEFQSVVRDSVSQLHSASIHDLQIDEDLINLEDSTTDFSKHLRKTLMDTQVMEVKIKQDLVDTVNRNFKSSGGLGTRFQQSEVKATSKPSTKVSNSETENLTTNNNLEETITIFIDADQMPTQTITFKKSEIIPPTSYAIMGSEINILTPPPEEILDKTLQQSKVTLRNRRQKTSNKTILSSNKLQSVDSQNSLPIIDLQDRIKRQAMESCQNLNQTRNNSLNKQTKLSIPNNTDIVYNQRPLDMPELGESSESNCSVTQSLGSRMENPNSLASANENQVPNQNQITVNSVNSVKELTNFPLMSKNYLPDTSREEAATIQQQSTNSNAYSTNFQFPASSIRKQLATYTYQDAENSEIPPSICTVTVEKSASTYIEAQVYENSYRLDNTFNSQVVTNPELGNQYQNMYQTQSSQNQEPIPTQGKFFSHPYSQPIVRNIYDHFNWLMGSFYHMAPMEFYRNSNLVPSNYNYQFNANFVKPMEPLMVQQIRNTILPPLYNQTANYNFNTFNNVQAPSADGLMRFNPNS